MNHHSLRTPLLFVPWRGLLALAAPLVLLCGQRVGADAGATAAVHDSRLPGYRPGSLGLKFEPGSAPAQALREGRARGVALDRVPLSPELDALKATYGVSEILPVFGGFEVRDASGNVTGLETMREHVVRVCAKLGRPAPSEGEASQLPDLTTVYELKMAEDADVLEAVAVFSACPGVEYAEPPHVFRACDPPDDPYWSSSGSWGQGYDDLWGLKRIGCLETRTKSPFFRGCFWLPALCPRDSLTRPTTPWRGAAPRASAEAS